MAYNMFRIAAIVQGIAKRVEDGTASSAQARETAASAKPLSQLAWSFAQKA
jgi:aminoglycoside phosphotransferase (APT) family kinase protein